MIRPKFIWKYLDQEYPDLHLSSSQLKDELNNEIEKKFAGLHYGDGDMIRRVYILYHRKLYRKKCRLLLASKRFDSLIKAKIFKYMELY